MLQIITFEISHIHYPCNSQFSSHRLMQALFKTKKLRRTLRRTFFMEFCYIFEFCSKTVNRMSFARITVSYWCLKEHFVRTLCHKIMNCYFIFWMLSETKNRWHSLSYKAVAMNRAWVNGYLMCSDSKYRYNSSTRLRIKELQPPVYCCQTILY